MEDKLVGRINFKLLIYIVLLYLAEGIFDLYTDENIKCSLSC